MEFITYKEEKIPIRVSYYAIKHFTADTGKSIEDIDQDYGLLEVLFWYAMEAGYKAEDKANPFTRDKVEVILDEVLGQFVEVFGNSFTDLGATPSTTTKPIPTTKKSPVQKGATKK